MLLRVCGGMGCHLLISLCTHSETEDFCVLLGFFKCLAIIDGLVYTELSAPKVVVLRIALACIEGGIFIFPLYFI